MLESAKTGEAMVGILLVQRRTVDLEAVLFLGKHAVPLAGEAFGANVTGRGGVGAVDRVCATAALTFEDMSHNSILRSKRPVGEVGGV